MTDPIGTTASALSILDKAAGAVRWTWQRLARKVPPASPSHIGRHVHEGLELLPVSYRFSLNMEIPNISVMFYAVNYTRHRLLLVGASSVPQLSLGGGPSINNIPLYRECELAPRTASLVFFERPLGDSEVRAVARASAPACLNAGITIVARAETGRHTVRYGPVAGLAIVGTVQGPALLPTS